MAGFRTLVACLAGGGLVAACSSAATSADAKLCAEVERVVTELVDLEPPMTSSGPTTQEHRILASHLLIAVSGDRGELPSRELAAVVRSAGMEGTSDLSVAFVDRLELSYDACDDAGYGLDRRPLETLTER